MFMDAQGFNPTARTARHLHGGQCRPDDINLDRQFQQRKDGFRIERRIGTSGSYQQLASIAANTTTYADLNLANSTTYCYRLLPYNAAGNSAYSNENCAPLRRR